LIQPQTRDITTAAEASSILACVVLLGGLPALPALLSR
jgi:hypothetical protein